MGFQATTVVRSPAYEQVAEQLREAILGGVLRAGDELPAERELCAQFGVSRTTVREALRKLQAQGLAVAAGPTAPLRVAAAEQLGAGPVREGLVHLLRLGRVPLADLVELRCALESAAVASAATPRASGAQVADAPPASGPRIADTPRASGAQVADAPPASGPRTADTARAPGPRLADAHAAIEEMRRAAGDPAAFEQADVRFHMALVAASGNEAIQLVMLAVRDSISAHLLDALRAERAPERAAARLIRQHEAILAAVEAGDARDAEQLVRDHIMGFYRAAAPHHHAAGTAADERNA